VGFPGPCRPRQRAAAEGEGKQFRVVQRVTTPLDRYCDATVVLAGAMKGDQEFPPSVETPLLPLSKVCVTESPGGGADAGRKEAMAGCE
jgi:hypothetical protein